MSGDRPSRTKKPRSAEASGAKWHLQRGVRRDASKGETRCYNNGFSAPDQWQVQIQAQIQLKANVVIKTSGLAPADLRAAHFTPIDDVSAAVADALTRAGGEATLCVLPQGPQTIPYIDAPTRMTTP